MVTCSLRKQRTLANPVKVQGYGYWSGLDAWVEFRPAPENSGIVFVRPDLPDCPRLQAHVSQRVEIGLRTVLDNGRMRVEMIEHAMAALAAVGVDNCEIWIDRNEMPGLDGSAQPFVAALLQAGTVEQTALREKLVVNRNMKVGDDNAWIQARPALFKLILDYQLDYADCPAIGQQHLRLQITPQNIREQLADCRTFILKSQADELRQRGLCERVNYRDVLVFDDQGVIQNQLRYADECVRHKVLDFVGDFALAPFDVVGDFISYRSGHRLHSEMLKRLLQEGQFVGANRAA